jgi:hypothetical protein
VSVANVVGLVGDGSYRPLAVGRMVACASDMQTTSLIILWPWS